MNYHALILLVWVVVTADRYIEFRQECVTAGVTSNAYINGKVVLFSMMWPLVMPIRIAAFAVQNMRGKI